MFFTAGGQAPPGRPRPPSLASLMSSDCPLRNPCLRPAMWGEVSDAMRGGCPRGCTFRSEREGMGWDLADAVAGRGGVPPVGYYNDSKDGEHQAPLLEEGRALRRGTGTSFGSLALARVGADRDCGPGPSRRRQSHLGGTASDFLEGQAFGVLSGQAFGVQFGGVMYCLGSSLARSLAVSPVSLPCLKPAAPRFRGGRA